MTLMTRLRPKATPAWSQMVLLAAVAARMALSVALTILLGRSLSPQEFGFFALVATTFGLAHELADMGSGNVAVRGTARAPSAERAMLEALLGLRLVLGLCSAAACAVLALTQGGLPQTALLLGTAGVLSFSYVSAYSTVFQLRQAQIAPSVLSVLVQAGTLAASGALVAAHLPGALFAVVLLLREAAVLVGTRALAVRLLGAAVRPRIRDGSLRPFFGKAAVVAAGTLFYHVQLQGGPFFVQAMRPEAELGAFAAALRPLVPVLFVPWVVMLPLVPLLSRLAAVDRSGFQRQARGALDLSIGLGAVVACGTYQVAPDVLHVLYGAQFSAGPLSAVATLRWMAGPLGCSFATAAVSTVLLADNREWRLLQLSAVGLAAYAAANLLLLPRVGFVGSAMATAVSVSVLTAGALALLCGGPGGIAPGWRTLGVLAPAAVLFALLGSVGGPPLLHLAVGAAASGLALAAVLHFPGFAAIRAEQPALAGHAGQQDTALA